MAPLHYLLECDFELHKDFVQNNIRNLGSDHPDVILISEDGREVTTNKIFLSLFTPIFNNICSDPRQDKTATISVPFPYETLALLLQFLTTGSVGSQEEHQLSLLMEMMSCLKINTEDMKINQMFPRAGQIPKQTQAEVGELEEFVFEEHEMDFFSTSRMNPSNKRNIVHIKKESLENIDTIKTEDAEMQESDFPKKKSAKKKRKKSVGTVGIKDEASEDISEDHLREEENSTECSICKKQFKNRNRLEQHRVTHTKEKPYECPECGKKFGTPGILYNHGFVHNPPHHCELCANKFAQKSGLQSHMKKYHGSS